MCVCVCASSQVTIKRKFSRFFFPQTKRKNCPLSLSRREMREKLKNSARRKTRFTYMLRKQLPTNTTFKKLYNDSYNSTRDERSLSSSHRQQLERSLEAFPWLSRRLDSRLAESACSQPSVRQSLEQPVGFAAAFPGRRFVRRVKCSPWRV